MIVDSPGQERPESDEAGTDTIPWDARHTSADYSRRPVFEENETKAHLEDALERVAHGAAISGTSILLHKVLELAFTTVLTNGFTATGYGYFAVAHRLQEFLAGIALGFRSGLNRFLPMASPSERDVLSTFASALMLGVATLLAMGLFAVAPVVRTVAGHGHQFQVFVRVFALGLPLTVWMLTGKEILRALEEVGPLNLAYNIGLPFAYLGLAVLGVVVFDDLLVVAGGMVLTTGVISVVLTGWLVRDRGFRPRLRSMSSERLRTKYLRFTVPLFVRGVARTIQSLGFYPIVAVLLSGAAGGVFVVGILVGSFVRLPLLGISQFIPPVAAALYEEGHHGALRRLYQVTSRLILVMVTGLAIPVIVYREAVMGLFGPTFVEYASLLPGFVLGVYAASAAGSVAIFLKMTDNHRELLAVDAGSTVLMVITAVPLTLAFGLWGLVVSYVVMNVANNGLEIAVLYQREGLQPFTPGHAKPVLAGVPFLLVTLVYKQVLPTVTAPIAGTVVGVAVYGITLYSLGVTRIERRVATSILRQYQESLRTVM